MSDPASITVTLEYTHAFEPGTEGVWLGLAASDYHAAPGVSQSTLKRFGEAATPKHFKAFPLTVPTPDMEFGTVMHAAILEPDKLQDAYWLQPATYPSEDKRGVTMKPWHGGSSWCKAWLEAHADRPVLTAEQEAKIKPITERVLALPEFGAALKTGRTEVSWFRRDGPTGLLLKCRTDLFVEASNSEQWIFDLKKVQVGCASHDEFQKSVREYGYHIQAASYMALTGATHFVFVPFDDDEPFDACQWELDEDQLRLGRYEYRRLLNLFADCVRDDQWPGYAAGIRSLGLSRWDKKRLEELTQ